MDHKKVAIAMSGGADSSVAAALLVDMGCEVIGLTAHMWKDGSRCCSKEDVDRARKVCWKLGIDHYVINAEEIFNREVVDPFVAQYLAGRTPSPCVMCNKMVKFGLLLQRALEVNCSALATGHYVDVTEKDGLYHLFCAKDATKDQSYFLHRLSQEQLAHCVFPLADKLKKDNVLEYATSHALPLASRGDSQDLCFVPPDKYREFVEKRAENVPPPGDMVTSDGEKVSTHDGIHAYTIGQRKGLNVYGPEPSYVTSINPSENTVSIGPRAEAEALECLVSDMSWISGVAPDFSGTYDVRIRYRHAAAAARLTVDGDDMKVTFKEPQFAITPGQAAVVYDGNEVLGGGWIAADRS